MFRNQTFRLLAESFVFLALCQMANVLLNPPFVCNKGIGLGISIPVFVLIPLITLSLIMTWFFIQKTLATNSAPFSLVFLGASLLIGGAFSNIIDRFTRGCIPDYFALGWFPAFNLADMGISAGFFILIILVLHTEKAESHNKE